MKRFTALFLATLLLLTLFAACGTEPTQTASTAATSIAALCFAA